MKAVYKMLLDLGRPGSLSGLFVAEKKKVEDLIKNKTTVYFGEVLGKHSEVEITFNDPSDIEMMSDDPAVVKMVEDLKLEVGYNPFEYLVEGEDF